MTEYALILAAVAIVAYVTYQVMGQDIGSMVNKIDSCAERRLKAALSRPAGD